MIKHTVLPFVVSLSLICCAIPERNLYLIKHNNFPGKILAYINLVHCHTIRISNNRLFIASTLYLSDKSCKDITINLHQLDGFESIVSSRMQLSATGNVYFIYITSISNEYIINIDNIDLIRIEDGLAKFEHKELNTDMSNIVKTFIDDSSYYFICNNKSSIRLYNIKGEVIDSVQVSEPQGFCLNYNYAFTCVFKERLVNYSYKDQKFIIINEYQYDYELYYNSNNNSIRNSFNETDILFIHNKDIKLYNPDMNRIVCNFISMETSNIYQNQLCIAETGFIFIYRVGSECYQYEDRNGLYNVMLVKTCDNINDYAYVLGKYINNQYYPSMITLDIYKHTLSIHIVNFLPINDMINDVLLEDSSKITFYSNTNIYITNENKGHNALVCPMKKVMSNGE